MFLVKAVAGRSLPDMHSNRRALIGYKHDPALGVNGGFVLQSEAVEVPELTEYYRAVRNGDLEAANEYTARACSVTLPSASVEPASKTQKG